MNSSRPRQQVVLPTRVRNVTAVLGPTNTGKTHLAIERMLGHETGLIGLPLRLLAREVYDRVVERVGTDQVSLITGEEKIKPENPRYWVSTVEAMPQDLQVDFVAVDEIQLASDPERGHVFTHRLLTARGTQETLLLGSQTMQPVIRELLQGANYITRPRLSELTYAGQKKISRLPRRSAVVTFSANDLYAIAELIRRQRGGAAVVLGALSPRTRNAQVALYESGDVDHLVATDAVGMGLNLDVDHVAFAATRKFDGLNHRGLSPAEIGQIAGRAGRHMNDGTFGVTGDVEPFQSELIERLERHDFETVKTLQWRNSELNFETLDGLRDSLRVAPRSANLMRTRMSDDVIALETVASRENIARLTSSPAAVKRLWEVCQVPDYRKISSASHCELVAQLYTFLLSDYERIPEDWFAEQVSRADRTDGDIDTLANRIAHIRTWTFVSNRTDWLEQTEYWQSKTREIEDRLSDALHECLTQRFVDRRTSVLMRRLRDSEELVAEIREDGAIHVEKHYVGRLQGFRYVADAEGEGVHGKAARSAAAQVLSGELSMRARRVSSAKSEAFSLDRKGRIIWRSEEIGRIEGSDAPLAPVAILSVDEHLSGPDREKVQRRLDNWLNELVEDRLKPLVLLTRAEDITGLARGMAFRLAENFGILKRDSVAEEARALDQPARSQLRKYGVRFGAFNIYLPPLLKPAATELLMVLWGLQQKGGIEALPEPPRAGLTSIAIDLTIPETFYRIRGFHLCGPRAVRIDMLERLSDMIRPLVTWRAKKDNSEPAPRGTTGDGGFLVQPDMMSILGCSQAELADVLKALGFRVDRRLADASINKSSLTTDAQGPNKQEENNKPDPAESTAQAPGEQEPSKPRAIEEREKRTNLQVNKSSGMESEVSQTIVDVSNRNTFHGDALSNSEPGSAEPAISTPLTQLQFGQPNEEGITVRDSDQARISDKEISEPEYVEIWRPQRRYADGHNSRRNAARSRSGHDNQSNQVSASKSKNERRRKQQRRNKPNKTDQDRVKAQGDRSRSGAKYKRREEVDPNSPFAELARLKEQLEERSVNKQPPS